MSNVECYKCHRYGHRAFECRVSSTSNNSSSSQSSSNNSSRQGAGSRGTQKPQGIVCYSSRVPGHKFTDCPHKNRGGDGTSDFKSLSFRRGRGPYRANMAAVSRTATWVTGEVNEIECPIVPDTAAEITIVPNSLVYEGQVTGELVEVTDWQSSVAVLRTAIVLFHIPGKTFYDIVAVAPSESLGGMVLYSVPVDDSMAVQLLLGASPSPARQREEHDCDTQSTQTSASSGVGSVNGSGGALETSPSSSDTPEDPVARVNAVTRSAKRRARKVKFAERVKDVADANLESCEDEFMRLSNIEFDSKNGSESKSVIRDEESDCDSSGDELGCSSEVKKKVVAGKVDVKRLLGRL